MSKKEESSSKLSFTFRGRKVAVTHHASISSEDAAKAVESEPFKTWYRRCERPKGNKKIKIHSVEIQSIDMFGGRGVGFVKIKSHCTLVDGDTHHEQHLPGICFLRGNAVCIFVGLYCEDGTVHSLLVDQPRVPIGQVSCLELPAGMMDDQKESITGIAVREMEEECGIRVHPSDLVDLTELACHEALKMNHIPMPGIAPSPGGCDEFCRFLYLEKRVSVSELEQMRGRLSGLREHGEYITLTVVPMDAIWKISCDMKAMVSLFLTERLRQEGKLPPAGQLATPLQPPEPLLKLNTGTTVPQLAYGLYKVPPTDEGEAAISAAIAAGYRHFDTASFYENEATLGRALRKSGIPRREFFVASKIWNDAVREGREAVRESVEKSLSDLDFGGYFDLFLVHWPVPNRFIDAYKELEVLHKEGKLRAIGISNFNIEEYEKLVESGIEILPAVNQLEVSPVIYRPKLVEYFQSKKILVGAYKPLHRAAAFDHEPIAKLAEKYSVSPAQIMLRWSLQKGLIVVAKTANASRMHENRSIMHFLLNDEDMALLDSLTTEQALREREKHETMRKSSL